MASTGHTYGPSCSLQTDSNVFMRRASVASNDPPKVRAQFFYNSALPIDDPLSPVPLPSSTSTGPSKFPPRPFSVFDCTALEDAWQSLQALQRRGKRSETTRSSRKEVPTVDQPINIIRAAAQNNRAEEKSERDPSAAGQDEKSTSRTSLAETATHVPAGAEVPAEQQIGDPHLMLCDDPSHVPFDETMPVSSDEIGNDEFESGILRKRHRSPFRQKSKAEKVKDKKDASPRRRLSMHKQKPAEESYGSSPLERDTTGTPFLRVSDRHRDPYLKNDESATEVKIKKGSRPASISDNSSEHSSFRGPQSEDHSKSHLSSRRKQKEYHQVSVAVGVSRLHLVKMPELKMGPIYWDPVHDISSVVRGTWFYKSSMNPVEPDVANQLEAGYEYLKPWTPTYEDEISSCLEYGAAAELKIVWKLWPADQSHEDVSRRSTSRNPNLDPAPVEQELDDEAEQDAMKARETVRCSENRAAGGLDVVYTNDIESSIDKKQAPSRLFPKDSVIYANSRDAQILKPGQLPNVVYGRRPLGPIRKGRPIGVPVVRGFDYKAWEKIHPPPKRVQAAKKAREGAEAIRAATTISTKSRKSCSACLADEERPQPTDLVLVIHGIGQKLSERVESYHFTHAVNAFRRYINVEYESDAVQPWLRQGHGGIMVLPINWRSTLKLEEGGPEPNPNRKDEHSSKNQFNLKDITADSIPAVRNLISDVMLDIPYYLSHHRPKMIEAVIKEANRVYRLWCANNPGFEQNGRVHILAHSLGSVMAIDILSKQPTKLPKQLDLKSTKMYSDMFEFDTKNLFFCGSPAGFFLLLNKASLLPRKGRDKPGTEGEDNSAGVAGDSGTYGCLAVDNMYNVMHYNDPIAYRLNACVDVGYAASLQPAKVPSATASWMQYFGSAFRRKSVTRTKTTENLEAFTSRPPAVKMPSTVEMETHNFTQEEIAENRMYLLNDNGQIDFTLQSGGGPLEIQYLNMLSAHSSYWTSQDFVRFLVVEIGRKPGRDETMAGVRALKKPFGKK